MKQKIIKTFFMALVFGVAAIFFQTNSKGDPIVEKSSESNTASNSTPSKMVWVVDEKTFLGESDTNGLCVMLKLYKHFGGFNDGEPAYNVCNVSVISTTTNHFDWCWKGNRTNLMKIELLDSTGKPVEKTDEGLKYGDFLTERQYQEFFKYGKRPAQLKGYVFISPASSPPLSDGRYLDSFSIPELFKITEPGEYTLRVRIHMGQREFNEKKLKQLIMPPEVSAKIQMRTNEIKK